MTDRELLEAAARAAGFGTPKGSTIWTESEYPPKSGKHGALWNGVGYMSTAELWNPLTDDGDALRLAVALNIDLMNATANGEGKEGQSVTFPFRGDWDALTEWHSTVDEKIAATRRAIVRAAAAMGAA